MHNQAHELVRLQQAIMAWTDRPKRILLHSYNHFDIVKFANDNGVEVMFSTLEQTAQWIQKSSANVGVVFLVVDNTELQAATQIAISRPDPSMDIDVFSI